MNLANSITLIRIILVLPFVLLLSNDSPKSIIWAFIIFLIASFSDYLDGMIARRFNQVSEIGKFLDPLADKILVIAAFIMFLKIEKLQIEAWYIILIIAREFIINGLRTYAASKGIIIAASFSGKLKTVIQMLTLIFIFILIINGTNENLASYAVAAAAWITLYSGIDYLYRNKDLFVNRSVNSEQ